MPAIHYHTGQFPPKKIDWPRVLPWIGPASAAIARYDGLLHAIPNSDVLLSPLTTQEAVMSSRIEGTRATFGEVLEFEASDEKGSDRANDFLEVLNYQRALKHAIARRNSLGLIQRVIREAHEVLMEGVRGQNRAPGEYRRIPNWIGPLGSTIQSARYVPIDAAGLPDAMSAWGRYLHSEAPDRLVQLAILHAEFEAIHPFLDGNGRLGRLLIPLFLVDKGLMSSPSFYISAFIESHRDEYYDRLLGVSSHGRWTEWIVFFLKAIIDQAKENEGKVREIMELYREQKRWIVEITHSHHAVRALDWFFGRPVFNTSHFVATSGIPKATASRIVRLARDAGVLTEIRTAQGRRPAIMAFPTLQEIIERSSLP